MITVSKGLDLPASWMHRRQTAHELLLVPQARRQQERQPRRECWALRIHCQRRRTSVAEEGQTTAGREQRLVGQRDGSVPVSPLTSRLYSHMTAGAATSSMWPAGDVPPACCSRASVTDLVEAPKKCLVWVTHGPADASATGWRLKPVAVAHQDPSACLAPV